MVKLHLRILCRHCLSSRETNEQTLVPLKMMLIVSIVEGKAVSVGIPHSLREGKGLSRNILVLMLMKCFP